MIHKTLSMAGAILVASCVSAAATTAFTNIGSFETAIGGPADTLIDFESGYTDEQSIQGVNVGGVTLNGLYGRQASIEGDYISGSNPVGAFSVQIHTYPHRNTNALEMVFDYAIDYLSLLYIDVTSPIIGGFQFPNTAASGDSARFAGLVFDVPVTSVIISSVGGDWTWGIDNIAFGTIQDDPQRNINPVPLPASFPLLLAGGLALGALGRRRRRAA